MLEHLLDKKLLLVSGKGGTGKSLVSVLLASIAAQKGKKVLLAESAVRESAAYFLGHSPVGHKDTQVSAGFSCVNIDPNFCFEEYVVSHLGYGALYEKIFKNKLVKSFFDAMPGLAETMLLGRIYHSVCLSQHQYDLVIFDGPASGHFLSLLTTPDAILSTDVGGPLVKEVKNVHSLLTDHEKTGLVFVTIPEPLIVNETTEFIQKVTEQTSIAKSGLICNRSFSAQDAILIDQNEDQIQLKKSYSYLSHKVSTAMQQLMVLKSLWTDEKSIVYIPEFGSLPCPLSDSNLNMLWQAHNHTFKK